MTLGEKLFEESGNTAGFNITKVHPVEGITMEVSFTSDIRGIGRFPSGKNLGSGTMTQYPHGIVDASFQGAVTLLMMVVNSLGGPMKRARWLSAEGSKD